MYERPPGNVKALPRKVLIDTRFLAGRMTGMGRYVTHLVDELSKLDTPDIGLQTLSLPTDLQYPNLSPHNLSGWRSRARPQTLLQQLIVPGAISTLAPDLYHYPSFDAPLNLGGPTVLTCADIEPLRIPSLFPPRIVLYYWAFRYRLRTARLVIAISKHTAKDLSKYAGVKTERIRVVYLGVGKEFRPHGQQELRIVRSRYSLPQRFVLYVGNTMPHKNVQRLVKAFRRVVAHHHEVQLLLLGKEDKYRAPAVKAIEEADLKGSVRFLGAVANDDLPAIYSAASLFVLPSLYEGFGLPVLESMACGTPVIASSSTSIPEILGETGILVDPLSIDELADAMLLLLSNHQTAADLSAAALERSKKFSWRRCAEQHVEVYREALVTSG